MVRRSTDIDISHISCSFEEEDFITEEKSFIDLNQTDKFSNIIYDGTELTYLPFFNDDTYDFNKSNTEITPPKDKTIKDKLVLYISGVPKKDNNILDPPLENVLCEDTAKLTSLDFIYKRKLKLKEFYNSSNIHYSFSMDNKIVPGVFHYVGYNMAPIESKYFNLACSMENRPEREFLRLSNTVSNKTYFIFECSNSGLFLEHLLPSKRDICYVFCETGSNEELPTDPRIPKDLFTCCIFTPTYALLLVHIIRNYPHIANSDRFPFNETYYKIAKQLDRNTTDLILNSIAIDIFPVELYKDLIMGDEILKKVTIGFILLQFLLRYYYITPVSNPVIPNCTRHKLWLNLLTEYDCIINNSFKKVDQAVPSLFKLALETAKHSDVNKVPRYAVNILCNSGHTNIWMRSYPWLSEQCSLSREFRENISINFPLSVLFEKISDAKTMTPNRPDFNTSVLLHSLLYLACCIILNNPLSFGNHINFFDLLFGIIKENKYREDIQAMAAAIFCSLLVYRVVYSIEYLERLLKILDPKKPILTSWILMSMRYLLEESNEYMTKKLINLDVHFLLVKLMLHPSFEVRMNAVSNLSFLLGESDYIDMQIVVSVMFFVLDCSNIVRYGILLFLSKFHEIHYERFADILIDSTLSDDFYYKSNTNKIHTDFDSICKNVDKIVEENDNFEYYIRIVVNIAIFYTNDPYESNRTAAIDLLDKIKNKENRSSTPKHNYIFYKTSLRQLVNSGRHTPRYDDEVINPFQIPAIESVENIRMQINRNASMPNVMSTHIAYDYRSRNICVSTDSDEIIFSNKSLKVGCVTSMAVVNWLSNTLVLVGNRSGNTIIWTPENNKFYDCFTSNLSEEVGDLIIEPIRTIPKMISCYGSSSRVNLWDISTKRFIAEFDHNNSSGITALCSDPLDENVFVAGFLDGHAMMFDIRQREMVGESDFKYAINYIRPNIFEGRTNFFVSTNEGHVFKFQDSSSFELVRKKTARILDFDVFERGPIMALALEGTRSVVSDTNGKDLYTIDVTNCKTCAMHQSLTLISFGGDNGNIYEVELTDNGI